VDSESDFCTFVLNEIKELIAAATEEQCKEILLSLKTLEYQQNVQNCNNNLNVD